MAHHHPYKAVPARMAHGQVSLPAASHNLEHPILEFCAELTTDQWIEGIYQSGG